MHRYTHKHTSPIYCPSLHSQSTNTSTQTHIHYLSAAHELSNTNDLSVSLTVFISLSFFLSLTHKHTLVFLALVSAVDSVEQADKEQNMLNLGDKREEEGERE